MMTFLNEKSILKTKIIIKPSTFNYLGDLVIKNSMLSNSDELKTYYSNLIRGYEKNKVIEAIKTLSHSVL